MPDLKISELTAATDIGSSEFEIVQGGTNKRAANTLLYTPPTSDGAALGSTTLQWADLFLASGGVLNFANGNWVATHTSGILTVGTGDLRVTTAGTNTASVVTVGGTQTLTAKTLTAPTVTNYTETLFAPASNTAYTVDLANGTLQKLTSSGNLTVTLPTSVAGKSYVIIIAYGGTHTLSWTGGSTIKWSGGTAPTATSVNAKFDIFSFFCDGTNTYGQAVGLNY